MVSKSPLDEEFLGYDIPEFGYVDPTIKPEFSWVRSPDKKILREKGRRKSPELCVNQIREAVDSWRDSGYSGSSATTRVLSTGGSSNHDTWQCLITTDRIGCNARLSKLLSIC